MSDGLSPPALAEVLASLRAFLRSAALNASDGLHRLADEEADGRAISTAFADLADAYKTWSEDDPPPTLGDIVATVAKLTRPDALFVRALNAATVPLSEGMSDACEAALWRALQHVTSRYSSVARGLLDEAHTEAERKALLPVCDHFLRAYALCLDAEGRIHPKDVGAALAAAWRALRASPRTLRKFHAACAVAPWERPKGGDDPQERDE